jgi:hypothetical protein
VITKYFINYWGFSMKKEIAILLCVTLMSTFSMAKGHGGGHSGGYGIEHSGGSGGHNGGYGSGDHHGYGKSQDYNSQGGSSTVDPTTYPVAELSEQQISALIFMYQEEKMARDAYITLGEKWGSKVFLNIQQSEQKHMDAIRSLLEKYDIPVPVIEDKIGVFENVELQDLYNQLIQQGSESEEMAFNVGVLIEETDIADLEAKMMDATEDVQAVFNNLLQGSQSHLRAFNRVLSSLEQ